eukprot:755749-Hanusia_phi.AAC.3
MEEEEEGFKEERRTEVEEEGTMGEEIEIYIRKQGKEEVRRKRGGLRKREQGESKKANGGVTTDQDLLLIHNCQARGAVESRPAREVRIFLRLPCTTSLPLHPRTLPDRTANQRSI